METSELLKSVRKIEIKSRGLSNNLFAGQYHSAFKGRGMTFTEVREYQYGDDIRSIDWNVTARFGHPYVKVFEEERELTAMLLVDFSGSSRFGSHFQLKRDLITQIAAVLAFSVISNNDKIGLIIFTDKVEKFIRPAKGRKQILKIIRELLEYTPQSSGTDISGALRDFSNSLKKRCIGFLISDFLDTDNQLNIRFEDALRLASRKHEMIALRVVDQLETMLPDAGLVRFVDPETGIQKIIDTSQFSVKQQLRQWSANFENQLQTVFNKCKVDDASFETGKDFVPSLLRLFANR